MLDHSLPEILATWPGLLPPQAYRIEEREGQQPVVHAARFWPTPESFILGLEGDQWFPFLPPIPGVVLADPYDVPENYWTVCAWSTDIRPFLAAIPKGIGDAVRPYGSTDAWEVLRLKSWIGGAAEEPSCGPAPPRSSR